MSTLISETIRQWGTTTLRQPWKLLSIAGPKTTFCTLPSEPIIAHKKPFKVELVGGKRYSWCTCGHSKKQPFCDGAHKTKAEGLMPLRFVPEQDSTAWLCGCKYTNNPPYCDGTHKQDFIKSAQIPEQTNS